MAIAYYMAQKGLKRVYWDFKRSKLQSHDQIWRGEYLTTHCLWNEISQKWNCGENYRVRVGLTLDKEKESSILEKFGRIYIARTKIANKGKKNTELWKKILTENGTETDPMTNGIKIKTLGYNRKYRRQNKLLRNC